VFARNVSIHLKANSFEAFTKLIENETIPTLRKQQGFQGELTFLASGAERRLSGLACGIRRRMPTHTLFGERLMAMSCCIDLHDAEVLQNPFLLLGMG
jgi:hypothetical protein